MPGFKELSSEQRSSNTVVLWHSVADLANELDRGAQLLGVHIELVVVHGLKRADGAHDRPAVPHCLHHIPSASLTLHMIPLIRADF